MPGRAMGCKRLNAWRPVVAAAALAAVVVLLTSCVGDGAVRMGTEGAYPPYNFINDQGDVDGFERELGDELCAAADLECEWFTNAWETIIRNLMDGRYDTIIAGMSITAERDEVIDFTQPYIPPIPSVYFAVAGAGDEVVNGTIAAQVATIHADYLSASGATYVEYELVGELIEAVLSGEVDAALVDREFARTVIAEQGGRLTVVGPNVPLDSGIGIGLREGDTDLKDKLDEAIASMKADGSLNNLIRKWFDDDADTF